MQKEFNHFKTIEKRISKRLDKFREILTQYKTEAEKIKGRWTDEDREKFKNWNRLHDIETILECQLRENYFHYQNFCFDNVGIAVYNF
jgi:uncharacterized protein YutD